VETALLDRSSTLARVMAVSPAWTRVYEDRVAVIYRRSGIHRKDAKDAK
jgi:hypothetical protein